MGQFFLGRYLSRDTPEAFERALLLREIAYTVNGGMPTIYVDADWI